MKIGGLAVPYGPSKYYAEIAHEALKESNGKKVPFLHNFGEPTVLGHAELIETERGIYAVLNFVAKLTDEELIDITKNNRIGGMLNRIKYDEQHRVVEGRVTSVGIYHTSQTVCLRLGKLEIIQEEKR
jgi:hypothetical protein